MEVRTAMRKHARARRTKDDAVWLLLGAILLKMCNSQTCINKTRVQCMTR